MNDRRLPLALCALLALLGSAVMAGWMLHIEPLKSVIPGYSTMKFNTAFCFLLVGLGLAAAALPVAALKRPAAFCGAVVGVVGVLTLGEYLLRFDLGIDQLAAVDGGTLVGSGFPGRMSPLTASAWMALGPAIILLALGKGRRSIIAAHLLAGYAGFISFLAAAGYAFGAAAFWGIGFYTTMAVHTALGLLMAVTAAILTRSEDGWLGDLADAPDARALLVQLLPVSLLVPIGLGFVLLAGSGLGGFNAAFGFALFVPSTTLVLVVVALRVSHRARRGELALRASEAAGRGIQERLSTALAIARLGTFEWHLQTEIVAIDKRTCEIFGIPEIAQVHADDIVARIHPEDLQRVLAEIRASRDAMSRRESEYRIVRPDGSVRTIVSVSDVEGRSKAERIFGVFGDISERKALEEDLRHLNETLEERVRSRGDELERVHEQLRQSQKLEAMGQLTGGVAHDFNNLLSPIIGSLDLIQRRGFEGERTTRLLDGALASAERAKGLVQRLLAFARRQPLQTTAVDIATMLADMADLISATLGPRIRMTLDVEDGLPPARADANQLEMAILNLAVNARDAMPEGGMLTIAARASGAEGGNMLGLSEGDYVALAVADSGIGMDEATLARAIEPFFSTKGIGRGTGLGLSMVHGLTAQLGGALHLSSTPGEGTTVELWLPSAPAEQATPASVQENPRLAGTGIALLVDDEEAVRTSTAAMIAELGYAVEEAASAEQALERIESGFVPDIVITDHLMPGMSGTEFARVVQTALPGVPILVISGYSEVDEIAPDLRRLAKPFRQADIATALAELVRAAA